MGRGPAGNHLGQVGLESVLLSAKGNRFLFVFFQIWGLHVLGKNWINDWRIVMETLLQMRVMLSDVSLPIACLSAQHPIRWHTPNWGGSDCTAHSDSCPLAFVILSKSLSLVWLFFQVSQIPLSSLAHNFAPLQPPTPPKAWIYFIYSQSSVSAVCFKGDRKCIIQTIAVSIYSFCYIS